MVCVACNVLVVIVDNVFDWMVNCDVLLCCWEQVDKLAAHEKWFVTGCLIIVRM